MSRWFYIGDGSTFDGDMDISEKIVNYITVGEKIDIDALYFYYRSSLLSYWIKLDELCALKTSSQFEEFYSKTGYIGELGAYLIKNNFGALDHTRINYDIYYKIFNDRLALIDEKYSQLCNNIDASKSVVIDRKHYVICNSDIPSNDFKFNLIKEIYSCFYFIATISCGYEKYKGDPSGHIYDKNYYLFPITNNSGWHSYNSYLYALIHGLHIVGFSSTISKADGIYMCPGLLVNHDLDHITGTVSQKDLSEVRYYYENVMRSKLTANQKDAVIFTIWLTVHEIENLPLRNIAFDKSLTKYLNILDQNLNYGICLSDDTINDIKKIIDSLRGSIPLYLRTYIKSVDEYFSYVSANGSSAGYKSTYKAIQYMAIIYGINYLLSIESYST